ncbi:MAG: YggS family pyridoxal phosphate-dependent enzyme [Gemmatimonadota bacterium]|nr:YggS family pyridoxal phosphate-dependent enzyme [Gemmatimonadota bacterium]
MESMYAERLARNLPRVRERIMRAAEASGRSASDVRLIAVTKGHPAEAVAAALGEGLADLGENRVEELAAKAAAVGPAETVHWHMIGHLQRRQAGVAVRHADLIHSVDSLRLGDRLSRLAEGEGKRVAVLAQVNTSGEEAKSGFSSGEAVEAVHALAEMDRLEVRGLMTMAPFIDDDDVIRGAFRRLREIRDQAAKVVPALGRELSMGMTHDLEIAIEEGSTMVRIGTALFGERA